MSPNVLIILTIVFLISLVVALGNSFGNSSNTESYSYNNATSVGLIFIIVIVIVVIFMNYGKMISQNDISASLQTMFTKKPEVDVVVNHSTAESNSTPGINKNTFLKDKFVNEVFNIPGNYYTYNEANTLCDAYGARLANYDEIESAYNQGGEWCNYGWSSGQNAFFPTQKSTFNNLQKIKGHEHDCGRPGVNGGYIANPKVRFGVNCYGKKPAITQEEEELMHTSTPYPKTQKDILMEKEVDYWKNHLDEILVSPFNYSTWSK